MNTPSLAGLAVALALAGCASVDTHATFVTKTSVALVDADSAPSEVSFGYKRTEGYFGPRLKDGSVVPVVGFIRTNGALLGRNLQQVYATGCAAEVVAEASSADGSACTHRVPEEQAPRPMVFATGTTLGVSFSVDEGSAPSLNLGYRRKEASIIPVEPGSIPSVLATHGNAIQADVEDGRPAGKLAIVQYFATGRAADALAGNKAVIRLFKESTDSALGTYRQQERLQSEHALTTLGCLARIPEASLPEVWRNAAALKVLRPEANASELVAMAPAAARERYTRFLVIVNPDSPDTTTLLDLHRNFVCDLART